MTGQNTPVPFPFIENLFSAITTTQNAIRTNSNTAGKDLRRLINLGSIKKIKVFLPSLQEEEKINGVFHEHRKTVSSLSLNLIRLKELKMYLVNTLLSNHEILGGNHDDRKG